MGDARVSTRNLDEFSKQVATPRDVLFTPVDKCGYGFLQFRVQKIQQAKVEWALIYKPSKLFTEQEELSFLEGLNPTEWKDQDLYAVIGLGHLRIRATEDDIRRAYRQRCLKHHPDKRMAAGQFIANPDGDYFACIVKAFEILGSPKRRSYDSIDPKFDDYIPQKNIKESAQFFKTYGRWFYLNSQWSNKTPVPLLGDMFTPRSDVDSFYDFWYNYDSWREYSYLDEEEKEKGSFREERRWIDKQNKAARAKLKKEEMARIRQVVDNSYSCDPRIALFKTMDHLKKTELKEAKRRVLRQKQMEEEQARRITEEIERSLREKEETETREKELIIKKEKDALKKALKKERKVLRTTCQEHDYYGANDHKVQIKNMTHLEHLIEVLSLPDLENLNQNLIGVDISEATTVFYSAVRKYTKKEVENIQVEQEVEERPIEKPTVTKREWTVEEQKLLEQGLKTYPATDTERWSHIAECIPGRTKKECMLRFKDLAAAVKAKKAQSSQEKKGKAL